MNVFHTIAVARAGYPRVTLAQRVVDKIVANAKVYDTETGESLVGLTFHVPGRTEPDLYVLDTIPPDASAIRRGAYFEQGDDLQGDIFNWWFDNWELYRANHQTPNSIPIGDKWNAPLGHLGDWHKHPGMLTEPSWGDADTARRQVRDEADQTPQLLAILATVWSRRAADADGDSGTDHAYGQPLKIPVDDDTVIRIDCWYMSRHTRRFVQVTPNVLADNLVPALPPTGWHLADPKRLRQEMDALKQEEYATLSHIEEVDTDHQPPLEICLTLARATSHNIFIVVTPADYPQGRPTIRTVPMAEARHIPENADLFQTLWAKSVLLPDQDYPDWSWTAERTIVDLVQDVEARLAKLAEKNREP